MTDSITSRIAAFGWLRLLLFTLVVLIMVSAPEPQTRTAITWPLIVPTVIAPAMAPLVFMVVLLDLMMAKVMSAGEKDSAKKKRARRIMLANLLAAGGIVYAYLPFFMSLGG